MQKLFQYAFFNINSDNKKTSQPHMLYFSKCPFPLKYCICQKCYHLQFTTYHIADTGSRSEP